MAQKMRTVHVVITEELFQKMKSIDKDINFFTTEAIETAIAAKSTEAK